MSRIESLRPGLHLGGATVTSRILGLARAVLIAWVIGVIGSRAADAFSVANQLPNNVFWLISSGLFGAVLVPQIVRASHQEDGGQSYVNKVLTFGMCALAATTLAAVAAAPWLVGLYTRDWTPSQTRLAIVFAYWCLPQIFFYGVFSMFGEALNARRVFAPAAWAPLANNVVSIAGLVGFATAFGTYPESADSPAEWTPVMIAVLAGTTTLGVVAQAACLLVAWRRTGAKFQWDFRWRAIHLSGASQMAAWTLAIVVLGQLLGVVQSQVTSLASGAGASSFATSTAWLVFMVPYSVIAVTVSTIYFTRFSELGAAADLHGLRGAIGRTLRILVIAMLGSAAATVIASPAIARTFTGSAESVRALAAMLIAYLIGLPAFALLSLTQRAFYAIGDARTPFLYTCSQATVLLGGTLMAPFFVPTSCIAIAVALVQSVATTAQCVVALALLRRKLGSIGLTTLARTLLRASISMTAGAAPSTAFAWWSMGESVRGWGMSSPLASMTVAATVLMIFSCGYVATMRLLRDPDIIAAFNRTRRFSA